MQTGTGEEAGETGERVKGEMGERKKLSPRGVRLVSGPFHPFP